MKRPATLVPSVPAVPTRELEVTTVKHDVHDTAFLCVEIGDHFAMFSGGAGRSRIVATTDGKRFYRRPTPRGNGLRGARVIGDELWIVGEYGLCAVSRDRGATWDRIETPTRECLWDLARDTKGTLWIAGSGGALLRAKLGGKRGPAFKKVKHALKPRDERADPRVEVVPAGVMFMVFNGLWDGKQLVKARGLKGACAALAAAPTGTLVMVGDKGAAFRSTDGGASWKPVATGVAAHLNDVAFVAGGFLAVGDKGTLRHSIDDGLTWKPLASGTKAQLWSIGSWGRGAFVGGDEGTALRISAPDDTYWKDAVDAFAPKPVVPASFVPLRPPTLEQREARYAELFAAATAAQAERAAKLPAHRQAPDGDHDARICAAIDDVEEYLVYADVLQGRGDPRGELIALQAAGRTKEASTLLKRHRAALVGPLGTKAVTLDWRWGFVRAARIANYYDDDYEAAEEDLPEVLATLLAHPSARFLRELTVGIVEFEDNAYDEIIAELARTMLPSLRRLYLGDFSSEETELSWSSLGDASRLCGALGALEQLTLRSGSMVLGKPGALVLPRLRELEIITGGLDREDVQAIERAALPSLEKLSLCLGTSHYGCDLELRHLDGLLRSDRLPRLRHLGVRNAELTDALCARLHTSPLVAQVQELDLSLGTMSDDGAHAIATYAAAFQHLATLDVSANFLTRRGIGLLEKALPTCELVTKGQREPSEYAGRYVAISE